MLSVKLYSLSTAEAHQTPRSRLSHGDDNYCHQTQTAVVLTVRCSADVKAACCSVDVHQGWRDVALDERRAAICHCHGQLQICFLACQWQGERRRVCCWTDAAFDLYRWAHSPSTGPVVVCSCERRRMFQSVTPWRDMLGECSRAKEHFSLHCWRRPTVSVDWCAVTPPGRELTSLTACMVSMSATVRVATSAVCLHRLTTLARHSPWSQRHTPQTFVDRRRCHVAVSSAWRWCLPVVHVF